MKSAIDPQQNRVLVALAEVFIRFQQLEQVPRHFGTEDLLYPAEIHTIEYIGDHPATNATAVADLDRALEAESRGGPIDL